MPNPSNPSSNGRNGKHAALGKARKSHAPRSEEEVMVSLAESGRFAEAAREEVLAQREAGLPITYKLGDEVVTEHSDGRREVIETIKPPAYRPPRGVARIRKG